MKKRFSIFLFFTLFTLIGCNTSGGSGAYVLTEGVVNQSKEPPLKTSDERRCTDCKIKLWQGESSSATYYITPSGFEYDRLEAKGYKMHINVSYDVYFVKDYNVIGNIGYAGSPKYEVGVYNSDDLGVFENDLPTTKEKVRKSIQYTNSIENIKNTRIMLRFSTDNIQNTIHIQNIVVKYNCY